MKTARHPVTFSLEGQRRVRYERMSVTRTAPAVPTRWDAIRPALAPNGTSTSVAQKRTQLSVSGAPASDGASAIQRRASPGSS